MKEFAKPDPVFGYDLDVRRWSAIRKEMAGVENRADAALGVKAIDGFRRAIDHPPPKQAQIDALLKAVNSRSITVARNASVALDILACIHASVRAQIKAVWPTLGVKGRWALLWSLVPRTPETDALLREIIVLALDDRNAANRHWAVRVARNEGYREFLPRIRAMAPKIPKHQGLEIHEAAEILEHGFAYRHDPIGNSAGMMSVARPDELCSFTVQQAAIDALGISTLGRLASAAFRDPKAWETFEDLLQLGHYKKLGDWAKRL